MIEYRADRRFYSIGGSSLSVRQNIPVGFTPHSLPGIRSWFRTDSGLYTTSAKTTAAAANNDPVGAWSDRTSNALDLTQATEGARGTLKTNVVNGHAAVEFDGSADYLASQTMLPVATSSFEVGFTNTGLAYDSSDGTFWHGDYTNSKIVHTSITGAAIDDITITGQPQGVAYDSSDDTLWWADNAAGYIRHIDMAGDAVGSDINCGALPNGLAYEAASDSVWVLQGSTAKRYLCSDNSLAETLTVAGTLTLDGIAYEASTDSLWITVDGVSGKRARLLRVAAADGTILETFSIFAWPEGLAVIGDYIYLAADAEFHGAIPDGNRVWKIAKSELTTGTTFCIWADTLTIPGTGAIVAYGNGVSISNIGIGVGLYVTTATNTRSFICDGAANRVFEDRTIGAGWRFLCLVVNWASAVMQVYDAGAQVGADMDISALIGSYQTYYRTSIGASIDGDALRPCNVQIAEMAVYNRALSTDEITQLDTYGGSRYGV